MNYKIKSNQQTYFSANRCASLWLFLCGWRDMFSEQCSPQIPLKKMQKCSKQKTKKKFQTEQCFAFSTCLMHANHSVKNKVKNHLR